MGTAEAISHLREKLGLNQRQFAKLLKVTPYSISRYENGREPASHLLAALADLAKESGYDHLYELFQAKRRSDVAVQVEKLSSSGSARRIPIREVNYFNLGTEFISLEDRRQAALAYIDKLCSPETTPEERQEIKENLQIYINERAKVAREMHDQMQPYSDPTRPAARDVYAVHSLMSEDDGTNSDLDKMSTPELIRLAKETAEETEQIARDTRRLANEATGTTENRHGDSITKRRKAG